MTVGTGICSSTATATSSATTLTVNPLLTPSVAIAVTSGTNPTCSGTAVTFTATPTNGGTSPTYQWKKGGTNISGETAATYTDAGTTSGAITVVMTVGTGICSSAAMATSSATTLTVNTLVTANAGTNITQAGATFTMAANNPSPGTGMWTVQSGTATITDATSSTTTVTGIAIGSSATLRWTITNGACSSSTSDVVLTRTGVALSAKVILEGPYNSGTGKMSDDLRTGGYLQTTSPYTTGAGFTNVNDITTATTNSVFTTTGDNAIVDWIFIELRSKTNAATVLATRSALLQRDGDVVDIDGTSPVAFNTASDNYYIAVRHRNHMAFRGAATVALSATAATIDFTSPSVSTTTSTNSSRKTVGSIKAMYAGDSNHDGSIDALDRNAYLRPQFGTMGINKAADFNLDGSVDALDLNLYFRVNYGVFNDID